MSYWWIPLAITALVIGFGMWVEREVPLPVPGGEAIKTLSVRLFGSIAIAVTWVVYGLTLFFTA